MIGGVVLTLPKLTAFIGKNIPSGLGGEFGSLIKEPKKVKEDEKAYIVFFIVDLEKGKMYFKVGNELTKDSVYQYYFFGNNSSAGAQYYLTRDAVSLKYLLQSTFSDLYMSLNKNSMTDGELSALLEDFEKEGFITLADKRGKGTVNLEKFSIINNEIDTIFLDAKSNVLINDKKYNSDTFIRLFIDDDNKKNKFVLVVPKVILPNKEEIVLSAHSEYLDLVKLENRLGESKKSGGNAKVCYICKKRRTDVSSDYSVNFDRTGINKIFTTTETNFAPYFLKKAYTNAYSMCNDCYQNLRFGEKHIAKQFKSKIAGEDVFLLPEGILKNFEYQFINTIKSDVDLAFNDYEAEMWTETIEEEKDTSYVNEYFVNFIFYRTDGNSVTVLETIEDVPTLKIEKIRDILADYTRKLKPHTDNISIGSIYRLVPVKVNKNKEQLDIGRVLTLYKGILSGEKINNKIFFDYATEALEKGLRQLNKSMVDNYLNLGLTRFINGNEDFFIKRIVYGYIVLIKACQELGILDENVFKFEEKVVEFMDNLETSSNELSFSNYNVELYLDQHGFDDESKMLFYLGILINVVAKAQVRKGHLKKPVLKKIQFQGMNKKEIKHLYNDIQEKLIQYDLLESKDKEKISSFSEYIMHNFHHYYMKSKPNWKLNEKANVFIMMAGYSYNVIGKKKIKSKVNY